MQSKEDGSQKPKPNPSVKFAAYNEVQDIRKGTIKSSKSMDLGTKSGTSFRQSFTGKGTAASRAASRRRRFWRKLKMRCNPRYWIHVANKRLPIIHPNAWYRVTWDIFVLVLVLYNAVLVPYQIGFSTPRPDILTPLNYAIDIIFAIDICFNFRTAYYDRTATLVRDGGRIFTHYSVTWFPVDLLATIPYEGIVLISPAELTATESRLIQLLRLPRLLRLARLLRFFDRLRGANYVRMVKLTMAMGFVAHWITCAWRFVYEMTKMDTQEWTYDEQIGDGAAEITYYLQGYLNSFLTMIGNDIDPANDVERGFAIFVNVGGACFYAIIIGNMSVLVNSLNPTASRHKFKKDMVANTVRYLNIPGETQTRINEYFEYLTTYCHPGPEAISLLNQLPVSMFHDITAWMFFEIVNKVPLFEGCENAFIAQLVMRLKLGVFLPGEDIFHIGDVGHEMYFITKGNVAVMNANKEMLALLSKGGFFGELALLATARRTAQCTALSNCDLACLKAPDLVAAMRGFPETAAKVRQRAMGRMLQLQAAGNMRAEPKQMHEAPKYLKKLNPDAAKTEAENDPARGAAGGGGKLSAVKLQHLQHQLHLQEAQQQASGGGWQAREGLPPTGQALAHAAQSPTGPAGNEEQLSVHGGSAAVSEVAGALEGSKGGEAAAAGPKQSLAGAVRMSMGLKAAGARAKGRLLQGASSSKEGGRAPDGKGRWVAEDDIDLGSSDDWTRSTLALVAQAQGAMANMSGKVDGLQEGLVELHARLEKVETVTTQAGAEEPEYNIFESGIDA